MRYLIIFFFTFLIAQTAYSRGHYRAPSHRTYHKRNSQKSSFSRNTQKKADFLLDVSTPKGYVIMLNTQSMTAQIEDDPYLEYEQIIDNMRPYTYIEMGFVINLEQCHR